MNTPERVQKCCALIGRARGPHRTTPPLHFSGILLHCFIKHHSAIHTASHTLSIQQAAMAPKAEKKPAKKVAKTAKTGSKKKSRVKVESFKIYIYKVLKQASTPGPASAPCGLLNSVVMRSLL